MYVMFILHVIFKIYETHRYNFCHIELYALFSINKNNNYYNNETLATDRESSRHTPLVDVLIWIVRTAISL